MNCKLTTGRSVAEAFELALDTFKRNPSGADLYPITIMISDGAPWQNDHKNAGKWAYPKVSKMKQSSILD